MKWSIRELLNPVVTRSMLYGSDPFDTEYVLKRVDEIDVMSGKKIQAVWLGEWGKKIAHYAELRDQSEAKGNRISARAYAKMVAQSWYACYMVNIQDLEQKVSIYNNLAESYRKYTELCDNKIEYIEIDTAFGKLPAYIHYPDDGSKESYPIAITYSGIGSCKEELDMLAMPLNERGVAVITPDMPGTGGAVIWNNVKCGGDELEAAFESIYKFIDSRSELDSSRIANFGLCMGGGYAIRATVKNPAVKCCAALFPLMICYCKLDSVPIWMKKGKWTSCQTNDDYIETMNILSEGTLSSDFLLVHSDYDNWMTHEANDILYSKATGYKERLEVTERPAYVSEETIMHAMPVGEQFHWVKHITADFIAQRLTGETR
ncbi:MAG: alpha/beta hydrolase [Ruminococcus sp.]|uniref:alpha/beta hydrolase n=1 Tax=Ruminococcus sp. TaxID=41978 RepID=UPI0025CF9FA5|nr:alpha/beta hydrolase [Ruminococcus sp.]MCR5540997.1 alpha/beta hydrolase [Ruminococcus sp.]